MLLFCATSSSAIDWLAITFDVLWSNLWWRFLQPSILQITFDWHCLIPCSFAKQVQHNLYVSTTFSLSANNFDWNFGPHSNLCAFEHNQHLVVLLFELSDCKWLFILNSWLVCCLYLLLSWLATIFAIRLKYRCIVSLTIFRTEAMIMIYWGVYESVCTYKMNALNDLEDVALLWELFQWISDGIT